MTILNPYDFVGKFHNESLDSIMLHSGEKFDTEFPTDVQKAQQIIKGTKNNFRHFESLHLSDNYSVNEIIQKVKIVNLWNEFIKNKNNLYVYSEEELQSDVRLLSRKFEALLEKTDEKTDILLEELEQDFLLIEAPEEQICVPLCAISVAKNSRTYWSDVSNIFGSKENNTGNQVKPDPIRSSWAKWFKNKEVNMDTIKGIWKEDVKGAFKGGGKAIAKGNDLSGIIMETAIEAVFSSATKAIFKQ